MRTLPLLFFLFLAIASCESDKEHMAAAVNDADSVAFMRSRGVSTLISDSGVIRYKLVAEEWDIYTHTQPATWKFMKGFFMERFDEELNVDLYVQSDTAYLHEQRLWELRGRVCIRNAEGTVFRTEELFWDMDQHEMWNHMHMHIITPERELEGTDFRSNEQMTDYSVSNSSGAFPVSDTETTEAEATDDVPADSSTATPPAGRVMPSAPGKESHWKTS